MNSLAARHSRFAIYRFFNELLNLQLATKTCGFLHGVLIHNSQLKNGALDEGAIDIAGGGVDLKAVDLAAAHLVAHHTLVGAGIEHGQHATARAHEDVALVLEGDGPSQPAPVEASDHQDSTGEMLLWLRFSLNSPMVCVNSVSLC